MSAFNYHTIPLAKKAIIPKDEWKLFTFAFGDYWAFNLLEYIITNEMFCWGTEKSLDGIYKIATGKDKAPNSEMMIHFYKSQPKEYISTWDFLMPDPADPAHAGYYICSATQEICWLCPLWTEMWGEMPATLYIQIK